MGKSRNLEEGEEVPQNFEQNGSFYIFGELDDSMVKGIIAPLQDAINSRVAMKSLAPIEVFINSCGGNIDYVFTIISLFEKAKSIGIEVQTTVYSEASSGAALIAMAGHVRYATESAVYMLHYARGHTHSHNPVMSDRNAKYDKFIHDKLVDIIKKYASLPSGFEKDIIADHYYIKGGKELKKLGLIDNII